MNLIDSILIALFEHLKAQGYNIQYNDHMVNTIYALTVHTGDDSHIVIKTASSNILQAECGINIRVRRYYTPLVGPSVECSNKVDIPMDDPQCIAKLEHQIEVFSKPLSNISQYELEARYNHRK